MLTLVNSQLNSLILANKCFSFNALLIYLDCFNRGLLSDSLFYL